MLKAVLSSILTKTKVNSTSPKCRRHGANSSGIIGVKMIFAKSGSTHLAKGRNYKKLFSDGPTLIHLIKIHFLGSINPE